MALKFWNGHRFVEAGEHYAALSRVIDGLLRLKVNTEKTMTDLAFSASVFTSSECTSCTHDVLRRMRFRAAVTGRWGHLRTLNQAVELASKKPAFLAALSGHLGEEYTQYAAANAEGEAPVLDFVKWLLQWFLDNADKIIAIITKLIPLFVV